MGFYGIYHLVMTNIAIENDYLKWIVPLKIVMFHSYVSHYQRVGHWIFLRI